MLTVPSIEANIGIEVYASKTYGIGGRIRRSPEDFVVEEILIDGSKASIQPLRTPVNTGIMQLGDHGRYLVCLLIKKGIPSLLAIERIAECVGVRSDRISFAGIKDSEALTAQYISIGGVSPDKISNVHLKDLSITPLGFSNEDISPKKLFGNKFLITIRSIKLKKSTVQKRIERIRSELALFGGMPNFFGHQRFGTIRPITHIVGGHIVKGDFKSAIMTFLTYESPFERPDIRKLRIYIHEKSDFNAALKSFPKAFLYEKLILNHLVKSPNDFLGALYKIPLNLRKIFVQAYQSFLFNKFLSERMKHHLPLKEAQIGDYAVKMDSFGLPTKKFVRVEASNISFINEEIKRGEMAVAIPLIGLKQPPSEGLQGEIEKDILEKEGISQENFRNPRMIKVNILGGLRPALARIIDFEASIIEDDAISSGNSARFGFVLHKGSYATILLREFMKPSSNEQLVKSGF